MTCNSCSSELLTPLPNEEETLRLRKLHSRRKLPSLITDQEAYNKKLGWFRTQTTLEGLIISWSTANGKEHSEQFKALEREQNLVELRKELGWLIADFWNAEGLRLLRDIPDPNLGMKESSRFFVEENRWRGWAVKEPFIRDLT